MFQCRSHGRQDVIVRFRVTTSVSNTAPHVRSDGPTPRVADALIVVLGGQQSLSEWQRTGTITRELALYQELAKGYGEMIFVSCSGQDDQRVARNLELGARVITLGGCEVGHAAEAVSAILDSAGTSGPGLRSATIVTDELVIGALPVAIASRLRVSGMDVALVARGGSLASRFLAHELGGHSVPARTAATSEHLLVTSADLVVGTTLTMVEDLIWRDSIDRRHTAIVPSHVINFEEQETPRENNRIVFCGPLIARKRVDLLIRAIAMLPEPWNKSAVLDVIGDGPEGPTLKALAQELGVNAVFHGWMSHQWVLQKMATCAIYADASALENHPRPILDAMSTGAALVVADIAAMRDLIQTGVTGLRALPKPEAMAQTIEGLLQDDDWRRTLGAGAANHVREIHSIEKVVPQHLAAHKLAHELAAARPNPISRLRDIKLLVCDFDGVFTDNRVFTDQNGVETVACSRGDGMGLEMLRKSGVAILVLSKETNPVVTARCNKLKLECMQGVNDKLPALQQLAKERGLTAREIAYLGNDTNDLGPLSWVGLPCVVADVHPHVLPTLQRPGTLVLSKEGGFGAVRELCDMLRAARA